MGTERNAMPCDGVAMLRKKMNALEFYYKQSAITLKVGSTMQSLSVGINEELKFKDFIYIKEDVWIRSTFVRVKVGSSPRH